MIEAFRTQVDFGGGGRRPGARQGVLDLAHREADVSQLIAARRAHAQMGCYLRLAAAG
jgi:hypothetical protein